MAVKKKCAGKPKENWVDCLEEDCARANIPYGSWTEKEKKLNHLAEINLVTVTRGNRTVYYYDYYYGSPLIFQR
jgi:hypothetical protein